MSNHKGKFVISLDFELHWGVRDLKTLEKWKAQLVGGRVAVARLLELFDRHSIHATWATVGFLLFETRDELMKGLPERKPKYANRIYCPYEELGSIGSGEAADPYHYAASLVRMIAAVPHQEIGSQTFSHYYCLEEGQDAETFRSDLNAAIAAARRFNLPVLSLVFPRNQITPEYLRICEELGVMAFRGTPDHWIYKPRARGSDSPFRRALRLLDSYVAISGHNTYSLVETRRSLPLDATASRYLRPYTPVLHSLEALRLRRVCSEMTYAAKNARLITSGFIPRISGCT